MSMHAICVYVLIEELIYIHVYMHATCVMCVMCVYNNYMQTLLSIYIGVHVFSVDFQSQSIHTGTAE